MDVSIITVKFLGLVLFIQMLRKELMWPLHLEKMEMHTAVQETQIHMENLVLVEVQVQAVMPSK